MNGLGNVFFFCIGQLLVEPMVIVKNPYILGWYQIFQQYVNGEYNS